MSNNPTSIDDLKDDPVNPRQIAFGALDGLTNSLSEFGDLSGIVWSADRGHLIAGHQRLSALKAKHGDALKIEGGAIITPDGEAFPIRVVSGWSEAKEKAANLSANNPAISGTFTPGVLPVLADIKAELPELIAPLMLDIVVSDFEPGAIQRVGGVSQPLPKLAFVLIGLPVERFGELAGVMEKYSGDDHAVVETSLSGGERDGN